MNFKRGRAKNQRSGCLMCKPWKITGYGKNRKEFETFSSHKSRIFSQEAVQNYYAEQMADFFNDGDDFNLTGTEFDGSMDFVDDYQPTYRRSFQPRQMYIQPAPVVKPREFVASF